MFGNIVKQSGFPLDRRLKQKVQSGFEYRRFESFFTEKVVVVGIRRSQKLNPLASSHQRQDTQNFLILMNRERAQG